MQFYETDNKCIASYNIQLAGCQLNTLLAYTVHYKTYQCCVFCYFVVVLCVLTERYIAMNVFFFLCFNFLYCIENGCYLAISTTQRKNYIITILQFCVSARRILGRLGLRSVNQKFCSRQKITLCLLACTLAHQTIQNPNEFLKK